MILNLALPISVHAENWTHSGPYGGNVTEIATSPSDSNIVYLGTVNRGVWKSEDGGRSWIEFNEGLPTLSLEDDEWSNGDYQAIRSLHVHPQRPEEVFTVLRTGSNDVNYLYVRRDGCSAWVEINGWEEDGRSLFDIYSPWANDQQFFASTCPDWIYYSLDACSTWIPVNSKPDMLFEDKEIQADPSNPAHLLAGNQGIIESLDSGKTWSEVNKTMEILDFVIDPDDPQHILANFNTDAMTNPLYESFGGGLNWYPYPDNDDYFTVWEVGDNMYLFSDRFFICRYYDTSYLSSDFGETWEPVFQDVNNNYTTLGELPNATSTILMGNNDGVYRSNDSGRTNRRSDDGLDNTYVPVIRVDESDPTIMYAGGYAYCRFYTGSSGHMASVTNGIWKSSDGGGSWDLIAETETCAIAVDPVQPDTVYWGGDGVFRSYDGCMTIDTLFEAFYNRVDALAIHPHRRSRLFLGAGAGGVFRSDDYGETWESMDVPWQGSNSIDDIVFHPRCPDTVYVQHYGIYRTFDGGESWELKLSGRATRSIAVDPETGKLYCVTSADVLVSEDCFETSESIKSGINNETGFWDVAVDPWQSDHVLIAADNDTLYESWDAGETWSPLPGPYHRPLDLAVGKDGAVHIGTNGYGVWTLRDHTSEVADSRRTAGVLYRWAEMTCYPTPFNSGVTVAFSLPELLPLEVKVYDVTGRCVTTLYDDLPRETPLRLFWNGQSGTKATVSSGVYFVVARSSKNIITKKIVLLR